MTWHIEHSSSSFTFPGGIPSPSPTLADLHTRCLLFLVSFTSLCHSWEAMNSKASSCILKGGGVHRGGQQTVDYNFLSILSTSTIQFSGEIYIYKELWKSTIYNLKYQISTISKTNKLNKNLNCIHTKQQTMLHQEFVLAQKSASVIGGLMAD